MNTIEISAARRIGCGCFPVLAVAAIIIFGVMAWEIKSAAKTGAVVQAEELSVEDKENLCGLDSIVCDGELNTAQEIWIDKLEQCESSGNPRAVNPMDTDGTPSYGAFQFKSSTFEMYAKRYGIDGQLMDREAQKEIVGRMMFDPKVKWRNEFPACVRKLDMPPIK